MNIDEKIELIKELEDDVEQRLVSDGYWDVRLTNSDNIPIDRTAQLFRSIGRRVCRSRGWKVQTAQTKPFDGDDGAVLVVIMVKGADAEHQKIWNEKSINRVRRQGLSNLLDYRPIWSARA